jgi:hypothetical protein
MTDAEQARRAEVARIAEALFVSTGCDVAFAFHYAEDFLAERERREAAK